MYKGRLASLLIVALLVVMNVRECFAAAADGQYELPKGHSLESLVGDKEGDAGAVAREPSQTPELTNSRGSATARGFTVSLARQGTRLGLRSFNQLDDGRSVNDLIQGNKPSEEKS